MSSALNFVFGILLIIIWIAAGTLVTIANTHLTSYKNKDANMHEAYWFTFWAAFVTWTLIIIFIILVILSVVGVVALFGSGVGEAGVAAEGAEGAEVAASTESEGSFIKSPQGQSAAKEGISWVTIGFLAFAVILVSITGVLAAIAASSMTKSSSYDTSVEKLLTAHEYCMIAAIICITAVGLLVIGIIIYLVIGVRNQNKRKAKEAVETKGLEKIQEASREQKLQEQSEFQKQLKATVQQAVLQKVTQKIATQ